MIRHQQQMWFGVGWLIQIEFHGGKWIVRWHVANQSNGKNKLGVCNIRNVCVCVDASNACCPTYLSSSSWISAFTFCREMCNKTEIMNRFDHYIPKLSGAE